MESFCLDTYHQQIKHCIWHTRTGVSHLDHDAAELHKWKRLVMKISNQYRSDIFPKLQKTPNKEYITNTFMNYIQQDYTQLTFRQQGKYWCMGSLNFWEENRITFAIVVLHSTVVIIDKERHLYNTWYG